jgi:hypothetical protein
MSIASSLRRDSKPRTMRPRTWQVGSKMGRGDLPKEFSASCDIIDKYGMGEYATKSEYLRIAKRHVGNAPGATPYTKRLALACELYRELVSDSSSAAQLKCSGNNYSFDTRKTYYDSVVELTRYLALCLVYRIAS